MSQRKNQTKSTADQFASLFDGNWTETCRSTIRSNKSSFGFNAANTYNRFPQETTYLPQNFSSLTRPIGTHNGTVVELDPFSGLETLNAPETIKKPYLTLPLNCHQRDLGMTQSSIPLVDRVNESSDNEKVIMIAKETFKNMKLQRVEFSSATIPIAMIQAGEQCDQILLTPTQRREIHEYEKKKQEASKYIKNTIQARESLRRQLQGPRYHRGVIGLDSSSNIQSEVYGDKAKKILEKQNERLAHSKARRANLEYQTSSMLSNGNILIPESIADHVKLNKTYQSKRHNPNTISLEESKIRLFDTQYLSHSERGINQMRTQALRDQDLSGKQYNIITHSVITTFPSHPDFNRSR